MGVIMVKPRCRIARIPGGSLYALWPYVRASVGFQHCVMGAEGIVNK